MRHRHREEGRVKTEAETGIVPQATESRGLEAGGSKESSPIECLAFRLLAPRPVYNELEEAPGHGEAEIPTQRNTPAGNIPGISGG